MYEEKDINVKEDLENICEICGNKEYLIEFKSKHICENCIDMVVNEKDS